MTLETGLLLLKRSLSAEAFAAAAEIQSARPALARALNDLRTRDFQSPTRMSSAFRKTGDGFDLTLYDDGMRIHRGDSFGDFIANPGPMPAP